MRAAWILVIALAVGCSGRKQRPTAPPPAPRIDAALLTELSVLATATVPSPQVLDEWTKAIGRGERTLEQYVDDLLTQPVFAHDVMPDILFGETLVRSTVNINRLEYYRLKMPESGPPIAFLTKPCTEKDAVDVEPWWALGTTIKVCRAAYKPDVWVRESGGPTCNSVEGAPTFDASSPCGCGPNLLRCFIDNAIEAKRKTEAHDELRDTVAYVVKHDMPIGTLFSGTSTFRRRSLEGVYRWQQIEAEQRSDGAAMFRDLANWPEEGKWAERKELAPGQHAGLVTAIANLYQQPDPRQRQWRLFDMLWCTGVASMGVSTEAILSLKATSLQQRNEGWQELARRPICTKCHARMDYGFQFFNAYPSPVSKAGHFIPQLQANDKKGPLFLHDRDDPRGEAPLTPAGFSSLAMSQPEFRSCMSSKVAEHVFGVETTDADVQAVEQVFASKAVTVKALARAALLRYARTPRPVVAESASSAAQPAELRARLKDMCGDCHHAGAPIPDFESKLPPRSVLVRSLGYLSSRYMPKDQPVPLEDRLALGRLLVDHLWTDKQKRAEAYTWFSGVLLEPTTNRWPAMHRAIDGLAGAPLGPKWNALENAINGDQAALTPNVGLLTTLEAIRACKAAGKQGTELEACVEKATPTRLLTR